MLILLGIVDHIANQLPRSSKLHRTKVNGCIGTECLVEYVPAQPPMFTVRGKTKVTIVSIPGSVSITGRSTQRKKKGIGVETYGTVVGIKGRSEYIRDLFSNSSVATEAEFRTTMSAFKSRMYIISPSTKVQNPAPVEWIILTIRFPPFRIR